MIATTAMPAASGKGRFITLWTLFWDCRPGLSSGWRLQTCWRHRNGRIVRTRSASASGFGMSPVF